MKVCNKCHLEKPLEDFHRHGRMKDGRASECKPCKSEMNKARNREPYQAEKERRRGLMRHFNMTLEEYEEMFKAQAGCCAICKRPEWRTTVKGAIIMLSVDHDHACCPGRSSCGKCVRQLLCTDCNTAMGLMNESVIRMQSMIDYITLHNGNVTIDENEVF